MSRKSSSVMIGRRRSKTEGSGFMCTDDDELNCKSMVVDSNNHHVDDRTPKDPLMGEQVFVQYQGQRRLGRVVNSMPELNMFSVEVVTGSGPGSGVVRVTRGKEDLRVSFNSSEEEEEEEDEDMEDPRGDCDMELEDVEMEEEKALQNNNSFFLRSQTMPSGNGGPHNIFPRFSSSPVQSHACRLENSDSSGYLTSSWSATDHSPDSLRFSGTSEDTNGTPGTTLSHSCPQGGGFSFLSASFNSMDAKEDFFHCRLCGMLAPCKQIAQEHVARNHLQNDASSYPAPEDKTYSQIENSIERLTDAMAAQLFASSPLGGSPLLQHGHLLQQLCHHTGAPGNPPPSVPLIQLCKQQDNSLLESYEESDSGSSSSRPINIPGRQFFQQSLPRKFRTTSTGGYSTADKGDRSGDHIVLPCKLNGSDDGWLAHSYPGTGLAPLLAAGSNRTTNGQSGSSQHHPLVLSLGGTGWTGQSASSSTSSPSSSSPLQAHQGNMPGRRVRSDVKKCRKVYGVDQRDRWCNQCKWKKACRRFPDPEPSN